MKVSILLSGVADRVGCVWGDAPSDSVVLLKTTMKDIQCFVEGFVFVLRPECWYIKNLQTQASTNARVHRFLFRCLGEEVVVIETGSAASYHFGDSQSTAQGDCFVCNNCFLCWPDMMV